MNILCFRRLLRDSYPDVKALFRETILFVESAFSLFCPKVRLYEGEDREYREDR